MGSACKGAGIRVMMVTGDHAATAVTIARWVNIITNKKVIHLTGENAEQLVEEDSMIPKGFFLLKIFKSILILSNTSLYK